MSVFDVLVGVRDQLLAKGVAQRVYLALPPNVIYPFVLIELEEVWSSYPQQAGNRLEDIQARVKFKVSIYSQSLGMEEGAQLSDDIKKILEGAIFLVPGKGEKKRTSTIRFLACVSETLGKRGEGKLLRMIHHFYDGIVRG